MQRQLQRYGTLIGFGLLIVGFWLALHPNYSLTLAAVISRVGT